MPFARLLQGGGGKKGGATFFAGAYTLANTQEVAVMSGLAAAWRLGAEYPAMCASDAAAAAQFDTYLAVAHGMKRSRAEKEAAVAAPAVAGKAAVAAVSAS